jgi:hypothetical protein
MPRRADAKAVMHSTIFLRQHSLPSKAPLGYHEHIRVARRQAAPQTARVPRIGTDNPYARPSLSQQACITVEPRRSGFARLIPLCPETADFCSSSAQALMRVPSSFYRDIANGRSNRLPQSQGFQYLRAASYEGCSRSSSRRWRSSWALCRWCSQAVSARKCVGHGGCRVRRDDRRDAV